MFWGPVTSARRCTRVAHCLVAVGPFENPTFAATVALCTPFTAALRTWTPGLPVLRRGSRSNVGLIALGFELHLAVPRSAHFWGPCCPPPAILGLGGCSRVFSAVPPQCPRGDDPPLMPRASNFSPQLRMVPEQVCVACRCVCEAPWCGAPLQALVDGVTAGVVWKRLYALSLTDRYRGTTLHGA